MAIKGGIAELGKAALDPQGHPWAIEKDRRFEPFINQTTGLQQVHQADRSFKGHGMKRDQGLFTRFCFHIRKNLFFVVHQKVAGLIGGAGHFGHGRGLGGSGKALGRCT